MRWAAGSAFAEIPKLVEGGCRRRQAQRGTRVRIRGATFIWGLQFVLERYRAVPLAGLNDLYIDCMYADTEVSYETTKQEREEL